MEPNKFEKHIKEQMQKREIQPSRNAWEKISERLEPAQEKKVNKLLWYSAAASFIGLLMVSILFFQSEDKFLETDVQIVDSDTEETMGEQDREILKEELSEEVPNFEDHVVSNNSNEIETSKTNLTEKNIRLDNTERSRIVLSDNKVKKIEVSEYLEATDGSIDQKIKEVLAQVDSIEVNNAALTNAEVDELLRKAQEEILRDRLFKQNASVDAMALLTEVEHELDQSFRDQIFESLKAGFLKVRTAVADRNK